MDDILGGTKEVQDEGPCEVHNDPGEVDFHMVGDMTVKGNLARSLHNQGHIQEPNAGWRSMV